MSCINADMLSLGVDSIEDVEPISNIEDYEGHAISDWVRRPGVRIEIYNRLLVFFKLLWRSIRSMSTANAESVCVSFSLLSDEQPAIALFLMYSPNDVLNIMHMAMTHIVAANFAKLYADIFVRVRITHFDVVDSVNQLGSKHIRMLVRVSGIVLSKSNTTKHITTGYYDCIQCTQTHGPFDNDVRPVICVSCQSAGPFILNLRRSITHDQECIVIQDIPNKLTAGRIPKKLECVLTHDLCRVCTPGDEVDITGVYQVRLSDKHGSDHVGFDAFVEVNNVTSNGMNDLATDAFSEACVKEILCLSKLPNLADLIYANIAPSIFGHMDVKRAIALSLFGGVTKQGAQRIRGDINILLLGDPATAKSHFLRYVGTIGARVVPTMASGSSAAGLTAYAQYNPTTKAWSIEAGALVLADMGICTIDEFDKINESDRSAIHEAMEQQTISISKAGIVSTLNSRCTIIASANPIGGYYDSSLSFTQNVNLPETILSRFDAICILKDEPNIEEDRRLATFVVGSHLYNHPTSTTRAPTQDVTIPPALLKKYILYAKANVRPTLGPTIDKDKIAHVYKDLREFGDGMPITVRQIESIIRMGEAHARMYLRPSVNQLDIDVGINLVLNNFIAGLSARQMLRAKSIFKKYMYRESR